ncbi:MAG: 4-hydroxy-tetrahydrodipicolinate synthase [Rickettsiales bacterium]|nr:4-hydroxy-tetrahydrodipicolinate synthase [Rickettsiales bacterium]
MTHQTYTALITPLKNNKLDEKALEKLVEYQIQNGVSGIVPCGTTGESPTLSHEEHNRIIELCVEIANKRIKIMAGTGSNSTSEAVILTKHAKEAGADSCLIVTPYYNKPTFSGLKRHYQALNECGIDLIVYNIPGRSVINITDEQIAELADNFQHVAGIKDATGDLARVATLRQLIKKDFSYLSGEDMTTVGFNAMGGNGIISVTANIAPKLVSDLQNATSNSDYKLALKLQDKLTRLHKAMFSETNPIPIKYAASLLGLCSDEIRLPLSSPSDEVKIALRKEMEILGLI